MGLSGNLLEFWKEAFFIYMNGKVMMCKIMLLKSVSPHAPVRWSAPDMGSLKMNVDASFTEHTRSCGGGLVLRDHGGRAIKVVTILIQN